MLGWRTPLLSCTSAISVGDDGCYLIHAYAALFFLSNENPLGLLSLVRPPKLFGSLVPRWTVFEFLCLDIFRTKTLFDFWRTKEFIPLEQFTFLWPILAMSLQSKASLTAGPIPTALSLCTPAMVACDWGTIFGKQRSTFLSGYCILRPDDLSRCPENCVNFFRRLVFDQAVRFASERFPGLNIVWAMISSAWYLTDNLSHVHCQLHQLRKSSDSRWWSNDFKKCRNSQPSAYCSKSPWR